MRDVVVLLVKVKQRQLGRAIDADGDRWCDTPALALFDVTARNAVFVAHGVEANGDQIGYAEIGVDRAAIIVGGADATADFDGRVRKWALRNNVDRATNRACAGHDRVCAIGDFKLLEVEGVAAAIGRTVANTVLRDVV